VAYEEYMVLRPPLLHLQRDLVNHTPPRAPLSGKLRPVGVTSARIRHSQQRVVSRGLGLGPKVALFVPKVLASPISVFRVELEWAGTRAGGVADPYN